MSMYREGPDPVSLLTAFLLMGLLVAVAVAFLAYAIDARTLDRNAMVTITHERAHASAEADLTLRDPMAMTPLRKGDKLK